MCAQFLRLVVSSHSPPPSPDSCSPPSGPPQFPSPMLCSLHVPLLRPPTHPHTHPHARTHAPLHPPLQHLPHISSSNPGKKLDFVANPAVAQEFRGQLLPYQVPTCGGGGGQFRERGGGGQLSAHGTVEGDLCGGVSCQHKVVDSTSLCTTAPHTRRPPPPPRVCLSAAWLAVCPPPPPQGVFGCDVVSGVPWPHTLFRLPLRSPGQAAGSSISKQAYSGEQVARLLLQMQSECRLIMLFLKSLTRVEVRRAMPGGGGGRIRACGFRVFYYQPAKGFRGLERSVVW